MKSDSIPMPRNLQLDFFRGLALMIIFVNHMPGNPWFAYTPSRLGLSDAAETFVFLSGFAAAIAFGRTFSQAGIGLGSLRVLYRCGQIYMAHLMLFVSFVVVFLWLNQPSVLNVDWHMDSLDYFFNRTPEALLALTSLTYVPNFNDILPMYFIILLWLPLVWGLSRVHKAAAMAFPVTLYLSATYFGWELTADPITNHPWYFNPFCWQLVFFTGFAFSSGWISIPRPNRNLILLCLAYAIFCYPLENRFGYSRLPWFADFREEWKPLLSKGHEGILRYLHFLAMAYLSYCFMYSRKHLLQSKWASHVIALGQQSLPIFMFGTCLSLAGGMVLAAVKTGPKASLIDSLWINLIGLVSMLLLARFLNWFDQKPWKQANILPLLNFHWPKQTALACGVTVISIAPILLLRSATEQPEIKLAAVAPDITPFILQSQPEIPLLEAADYQIETSQPDMSDLL